MCDDYWDINEAKVVCRQLGFSGASSAKTSAAYGQGIGPTLLDDLKCTGSERYLWDCPHGGWGVEDCSHSEDAGVVCY